jgi:hypothetical protein
MSRATSPTRRAEVPDTITRGRGGRFAHYRVLVRNLDELAGRADGSALDAAETLLVTMSLDETAAAHPLGIDTLFLLGGPNGLRDVAFCPRAARPTYVAMDIRALELPATSGVQREPAAEISPRGRVRLRPPMVAPPQEVLDAVISSAWRSRDRRSIMLTGRADLWREVERTLRDYWIRWLSSRT